MNAAVRTLTHRTLSFWVIPFAITRDHLVMLTLGVMSLMSAFSLVYDKDVNRRLTSQYEMLQSTQVQLHNNWSQLLVRKSAMADQLRIASLAKHEYHMFSPTPKAVKLIQT